MPLDVLGVDIALRPVAEIYFLPYSRNVFHLLLQSLGVIDLKLLVNLPRLGGERSFLRFLFLLLFNFDWRFFLLKVKIEIGIRQLDKIEIKLKLLVKFLQMFLSLFGLLFGVFLKHLVDT